MTRFIKWLSVELSVLFAMAAMVMIAFWAAGAGERVI